MSVNPADLLTAIDTDAKRLDEATKKLAEAITDLSDRQADYDAEKNKAMLTVLHEYEGKGERLPAEDVRAALVAQQVDSLVYKQWLAAKATVDAGKAWCRSRETIISARQTLLKTLTVEARG